MQQFYKVHGLSRRVGPLPRRTLLVVALVALLATAMACEPVPDRISLAGDSVLLTAGYNGGGFRGADYAEKIGLGWEAKHAQPRLTADVAARPVPPSVSVQAFGQNYGDRYQEPEKAQLMSLVFTPDPDACVVLVLPHPGISGSHGVRIRAVRQTLIELAAARPNTVTVDWSGVVQVHPEHLAGDGVHLSPIDQDGDGRWDAAEAYMDLIWSGVEACES